MNRLLGIVWFCVFLVPCAYGETITYDDGSSYVGDVSNGVPHGQGTYTFANGDKYVGKFNSLSFHGQGSYFYASGNKYVGEWKDDKQNGQGTFTWANGDEYVGEFKEGNRHGQGTLTWAGGNKYVGEWKDGKQLLNEDHPRSKQELIDAYKQAHASGEVEAVLALVHWGENEGEEDRSHVRSLLEFDFDPAVVGELQKVTIEPLKPDSIIEYEKDGKTYRPPLPPIGELVITFKIKTNTYSATSTTQLLVAEKDGGHYIVFAPLPD